MRSKKLAWLLALILVAVLSFTLIGCKPKVDDDDEKKELTTTQIVEEVSKKLGDDLAIANPRTLNIDIQGSASLQENVENGLFWKYELIAKGNINLSANAKEDQSNFRIEVNAFDKEGKKSTLISLLYESEMDANGKYLGSYFYLTLPGQDAKKPLKINAISLLKLIPGVDEEVDEINIGNYLGIGLELLTESADKVGDNSYKLNTNMAKIWDLVQTLVVPLIEKPEGELIPGSGIDIKSIIGEIDKVIPEIFPGLTYRGTNEAGEVVDVAVDSVLDLIAYVDENLPTIDISATFNFDANDGFTGAELVADYRAKDVENATHKFTLDIDALQIAAGSLVAYDDGYALTATQRKEMAPTGNILTFSIDGKMTFVKGDKRMPYTIDINADINPFVLVDGFDISKLKDIGSLSMIITNDTTNDVMFTLYINGKDKELIISYKAPGRGVMDFAGINLGLAIGGEYSFEALGAIINAMSAPAEASLMADEAAGQDVVGVIINALFSRLNFDNIATTGVVFSDTKGLFKEILSVVDLGLDGLTSTFLPGILNDIIFDGAESTEIGVKENGFKYGVCELADKSDLKLPGHSNGIDEYGELLDYKKAVASSAIQTTYENGEPFHVETRGANGNDVNNSFTISGKDRAGNDTDYSAVFYGVQGYDPYKVGTQSVIIYYGINSMIGELLNDSMLQGVVAGLPQMTPLFGAHMFKMDVTVYPPVDPSNVVLDIKGATTMFAFDNIAEQLNATLRYRDASGTRREVKVTNDMISSKQPVISNGSFDMLGKFIIEINHAGIKISQNVTVNEVTITQTNNDGIAEVNKTIEEQFSAKMRYYDDRGEIAVDDVVLSDRKVVDANGNTMSGILDADGKVIPSFDNRDKDFFVEYSYKFGGAEKVVRLAFTGTTAQAIADKVGLFYKSSSTNSFPKINPSMNSSHAKMTKQDYIGGKHVAYLKLMFEGSHTTGSGVTPVWDEIERKIILIRHDGSALPESYNMPVVTVKFTRVSEFDAHTNTFKALSVPDNSFNLDADHLTLAPGEYELEMSLNGVTFVMPKYTSIRSLAVLKAKDEGASTLFGGNGINLQYIYPAAGFEGCPSGVNKITMAWNAETKQFTPMMGAVVVKEADMKIELTDVLMYDTANASWDTADFAAGNDGKFLKEKVGEVERYRAYKATIKITIGAQVFEGNIVINKNYLPSAPDPVA